jgi:hypothetical protein
MRHARAIAAATAALSCGALAGCGDNDIPGVDAGDVETLPRQTVTLTQTLPGGTVEEGVWQATPSDRIRLYLSASAANIDWDIHAHNDGGTQDIAFAFSQASGAYDFTPPADGPWYLLLRNNADGNVLLDVGMELYGRATWQGFQ